MDLRSLRYFVSAVEQGSISAAAEFCHIAQPSISHAINQLEGEFDFRLLVRSKKGVSLTLQGEDFYLRAKQLLLSAQQLEQDYKGGKRIVLRIGYSQQLRSETVSEILKKLIKQLPDYEFVLSNEEDDCDLIIGSRNLVKSNSKYSIAHFVVVEIQRYALLIPDSWALAKTTEIKLADFPELLKLPWIDRLDCEKRPLLLQSMPQIDNQSSFHVKQEDLALTLVKNQQGLTIMAINSGGEAKVEGVKILPLQHLMPTEVLQREVGIGLSPWLSHTLLEKINTLSVIRNIPQHK
ncbi:MAG: LysR family transcriptional regulator [Oleispira sp.]|nr:LysR family transcriptional regulator [Oleispira sp.]